MRLPIKARDIPGKSPTVEERLTAGAARCLAAGDLRPLGSLQPIAPGGLIQAC